MNKLLLVGAFLLLGTVVLASCHPTKKTTGGKAKTEKTSSRKKKKGKADTAAITGIIPPSATITSDAMSQRLDALSGVNAVFQTFSGKAKAKLTRGDESNEFTANIRIRHGQAIWINISALGGFVNVARVYITPDSVRMLNHVQNSAKLLPFSEAGKLLPFPISFGDLEALLLGHAPSAAPKNTLVLMNNGRLERQSTNGKDGQTVFFALPDTVFRGYEVNHSGSSRPVSLRMAVENQTGEGNRLFYKDRVASWETPTGNGSLYLDFDNPQWDSEVSMPFSVPKNYERN